MFRKNDEPLRDVLGPVSQSHPEQWNEIINNMEEAGIEIIYRSDGLAYSPANCGHSGKIIIDTDAWYGTILHEYTHYLVI